ncbi:MAG: chitobiase/beta-hexosaminidase C-terminal domain-containing protein [Patescibacteria group bacterium]
MSLALPIIRRRVLSLITIAFAVFLFSALSPEKAHAAALTVVAATTTSNNASTTLAKVGNTYRVGLNLSGTPVATSTPVINIQNMGTSTMSGSGAWWFYSTTTTSVWNDGAVVFKIGYGDSAPGVNNATTTVTQTSLTGSNVRFDKTAPSVSTLTSDATAAGALKVGDTIVFTLTPGATEYGGTIAGSYNGTSLSWSTSDSGATFTATYTVTEGETDRTSALQISSVIPTDAAGNAGSAGAGSDVVKTIDANSPSTPPAATPGGGSITGTENVSLAFSDSSIRYTTDGSSPTCSTGTLFSSAISVSTSQTIKAIGCDAAGNSSSVASFAYTVLSTSSSGGGFIRYTGPQYAAVPAASISGGGLSESQVRSVLEVLRSFGVEQSVMNSVTAALRGQPNSKVPVLPTLTGALTRDLEVGIYGEDVRTLQVFLNGHGFPIASSGTGSPGNETTYFGALTKAALIKFQIAKGISPAAGYLGQKTRAAISRM